MTKGFFLALGMSMAVALTAASPSQAAEAAAGEKYFKKRCKACHTVEAGKHKVGPSLAGIVGKQAGTVDGFKRYKALKGSDITWDEANLDKRLENPKKFIGKTTSMALKTKKAEDRANVIEFLKTK